ncbi:hypothetical protein FDECE_11336 [Fusarium decemcellulare]|nr:hypothetical protein FDECE_11336 [Fusarium decemcellulare]
MVRPQLALAVLFGFLFQVVSSSGIRALYLFKDVMKSNTEAIKTSGFNSVVMFGVGILENGDIMYYSNTPGSSDVLIASNGSYTGGSSLADKVRSFKQGTTGIDRVEICMNSNHVRDLMEGPGSDESTPLYRNFAALKEAWSLDAVNNNDESIYHAASTVTFARMLGNIGYKYTLVPYTNSNFWASIKRELDGNAASPLVDRVYLQCYDGGASNDPISWQNTLGMEVVPLLWVTNDSKPFYGTTVEQALAKFSGWLERGTLGGGGYWNDYDIEKMGLSYTGYGGVLETKFP